MNKSKAIIEVYGADTICASCVNAPSSKDTYEWLQAAIARKFPDQEVKYRFINIDDVLENERDIDYANRIQEDEFFYPLVLINDEVVGEGYVQIKPVYEALEKLGYEAK